MSWAANGEGKEAVTQLVRALESGTLGANRAMPQTDAPEFGGNVAYSLPLVNGSPVPVRSAGGGEVLLVSKPVHVKFMQGTLLSGDELVAVMKHLVENNISTRFVKSTVFDNWSPAWLCWFETFGSLSSVEALKAAGFRSQALKLMNYLYDRFRAEVLSVASSSNMYKEKLSGFFRGKPSVSKFAEAVKKGKLPIAQSDAFVSRVLSIKDAYDKALLNVEQAGLFAPAQVTGAQSQLPIRDRRRGLSVIDDDVVAGPERRKAEEGKRAGVWRK